MGFLSCFSCRVTLPVLYLPNLVSTKIMSLLFHMLPRQSSLFATQGAVDAAKATYYLEAAQKLTHTCYQMYARTATGAHTP